MKQILAALLIVSAIALAACSNRPEYQDGKYIIWSGRGTILTAEAQNAPANWTLPADPPINERVVVARAVRESSDRLLRSPEGKVKKAEAESSGPNFLTEDEVAELQAKAHKAEADGQDAVAARVWDYLMADRPDNAFFALSSAKAWARQGEVAAAANSAREAWKRGFEDLEVFRNHKDFAKLKSDNAWAALLIELEVRAKRKAKD